MRLDENHEIKARVANYTPVPGGGQVYGDIYDSLEDMLAEHPGAEPVFGFAVADSRTGKIPDEYRDFYETIEAAYRAWRKQSIPPFKLTFEFDAASRKLRVDRHDGAPAEAYPAGTLANIGNIAACEIQNAACQKQD